jgi:hypothetical protein
VELMQKQRTGAVTHDPCESVSALAHRKLQPRPIPVKLNAIRACAPSTGIYANAPPPGFNS